MVYSESELIIPALEEIDKKSRITTTQLIKKLTDKLKPKGKDAEIISTRKDTYFSQKVRNLNSHKTLENKGLAVCKSGSWTITEAGKKYLEDNKTIAISLKEQGFVKSMLQKEADRDYKDIIIEEGALEKRTITQRKRSKKLKKIVIKEHKLKNNGQLPCRACGFIFEDKYGEIGKDFIEIHHTIPIHVMDIQGSHEQAIKKLKQVIPLCANCHRMVHRKKSAMLSIEDLKSSLT